tara:strand:+ start:2141 stop:2380 length:240 start_codon:yes stop_codon:yes gene_type:complete
MINSTTKLLPSKDINYREISYILFTRAKFFDKANSQLEDDFIFIKRNKSIHVLNSISPTLTSDFDLADEIINKYILTLN